MFHVMHLCWNVPLHFFFFYRARWEPQTEWVAWKTVSRGWACSDLSAGSGRAVQAERWPHGPRRWPGQASKAWTELGELRVWQRQGPEPWPATLRRHRGFTLSTLRPGRAREDVIGRLSSRGTCVFGIQNPRFSHNLYSFLTLSCLKFSMPL